MQVRQFFYIKLCLLGMKFCSFKHIIDFSGVYKGNNPRYVNMNNESTAPRQDIYALSFDKLLSLSTVLRKGVRYGKYCCLKEIDTLTEQDIFKYPIKVDAFILVICSDGLIELSCNLYNITLSPQTMFLFKPGTIVRTDALKPSKICVMVFTREFIDELGIKPSEIPLHYGINGNYMALQLTKETCGIMSGITRISENFIGLNDQNPCYHELIRAALKAFIYRAIYEIHEQQGEDIAKPMVCSSRERNNFKRFMNLLQDNARTHHNIHFYSEKMGLSAKYLSVMVKKVSGKLATEWIDEYVILEAKNMIKYSSLSIQEISYALNFPNQSFFGKFFKRYMGISPKAYRSQS